MDDITKALQIAIIAHDGQVDKQGMPYIFHPIRVMLKLKDPEDMIIAILHDVIEDTDMTISDLRNKGFSENVLNAVDTLTHRPSESYADYIVRVKQNPTAVRVKLADLADNTDTNRGEIPPNKINLYKDAIATLG